MTKKQENNPILTLLPLTTAALGTAIAMYPVDVLRALKMSQAGDKNPLTIKQYYQKFGVKGFVSQGVVPEVARASLMRASKFFFFPLVCEGLHGVSVKEASISQKLTAGALATFPEILMVTPIEVAKLGLQLDTKDKYKNSMRHFISDMAKQRGIGGLYTGWSGLQWRQSFWTGTYFATLQFWKDLIEPRLNVLGAPQGVSQFVSGFFAGAFAAIPCAPGDVCRSVIQKKVFADPSRKVYGISPAGMLEHISQGKEILKTSGVRGLYSGIGFKALHLGGSGALMALLVPICAKMMNIPYGGV